VHPTKGSESLSLPTPTTQDSSGICRDHGGDLLHDLICGCPRSERKETLLRTPAASEGERGHQPASKAKARGGQQTLSGQFLDLFPTPVAADWKNGRPGDGYGPNLPQATTDLMPTPTTRDYKDGSADHEREGIVQTDTVARAIFSSGEITDTNWGKFEPAIRRWEAILGRQAPEPTKPDGKDGNHRLSSKFTEWMMGLPDGWITGHNLKRNDELKLAGNGVVPQQAELALRLLLELPEREK
jgi:DNA (cytosine-5)-methyltransferase 1